MDRTDVENSINQNVNDNTTRDVSPAKVRAAMAAILDWLEFLELGGTVADLDTIYRKISDSYSKEEVDQAIAGIELTPGPKGDPGAQGPAGAQGAQGEQGVAGTDGQNGATPEIGANGNWWIDGTDTGIPTAGSTKTAYNSEITGVRGEAGSVFTLPEPFYQNTLKIYLDGSRLTPGGGKDYTELNETQFRLERDTTAENSVLVADYVPKKQA